MSSEIDVYTVKNGFKTDQDIDYLLNSPYTDREISLLKKIDSLEEIKFQLTFTIQGLKEEKKVSEGIIQKLIKQLKDKDDFYKVIEISLNHVVDEKSEIMKKFINTKKQQRKLIQKICQKEHEKYVLEIDFKDYKNKNKNQTFWIELFVLFVYVAVKVILF